MRIRDDKLNIMPGCTVEDMGHKMGLNGVDNAKISFDNVRVPRENLLNKWVFFQLFQLLSSDIETYESNTDTGILLV